MKEMVIYNITALLDYWRFDFVLHQNKDWFNKQEPTPCSGSISPHSCSGHDSDDRLS